MGPDRFRLLGVERKIETPGDWNRADWPKLWLYHLHYFDDWTASGSNTRAGWQKTLIDRWITENPPGQGIGWDPYPISIRLVNWIQWALIRGTLPDPRFYDSMAVQTRYLHRRLEIHLQGNHLWANAKALVFAGSFFAGAEAEHWLETGLGLLERELAEQVLRDGGHFERSPLYHAIVLQDVLDLIQLDRVYPGLFSGTRIRSWRETALHMLKWLRVMTHPDGRIAFFNDAAWDLSADEETLERYAAGLGLAIPVCSRPPLVSLSDSGYLRLEMGSAVLIADLAPVGPDYQPGHAHADTLSFELSLDRQRVIVNGGTSTYERGSERERQRGTAMHNTVMVDGENSSEVWGAFRVARRARPRAVQSGRHGETLWIEGAHDGYLRLPGRVLHKRRWELTPRGLRVTDTLSGTYHEARAFFRFAPGMTVGSTGSEQGHASPPCIWWCCRGAQRAGLEASSWHPRFGANESCEVLVATFVGGWLETEFSWA
jgi:uncharacterized heparinase superfamily protein